MTKHSEIVHVAVAVIVGDDGRILVARRPDDKHMGGLWEFPGGKIESGEDLPTALQRELQEELAIQVSEFTPLICIEHNYPDKKVLLDTWVVSGIQGSPVGNEGQPIRWVHKNELWELDFPAANKPIVNAVNLPDQYMVTGKFSNQEELFTKVEAAISKGIKLVQFRAPWLDAAQYLELAKSLSEKVRMLEATLVVKGEPELLNTGWCQGIHLNSVQLHKGTQPVKRKPEQWLVASCHNIEEIKLAEKQGMDFITLSPVKPTQSHPEAEALGLAEAARLTRAATIPVFWLGGMSPEFINSVRNNGAQGVAAIGAYW